VYETRDEFKKEVGKPLKYWKESPEKGEWVESDDGGIVQVLKVGSINHPNDRKNYKANDCYVRTIVGTFLLNDKSKMDTDFEQHPNRYTFSKKLKTASDNFKTRKKITNKEREFTTHVITGMSAIDAAKNAYELEDFKKAKKKAIILLKQERIMSEIEKGVNDIAKSLGINHEYVLNKLKCLVDRSDDDNIVLQSVKELGKIIGTSGVTKKDVGILGVFKGFSREQLEDTNHQIAVKPLEIKNGHKEESI